MVRHTLKILQQVLQDFKSVSGHFGTLCIIGLKKEFNSSHSSLQHEISFIDFAHVSSLFLRSNNRILASTSATQH